MTKEDTSKTKEIARSFFWVKFTRGLVWAATLGIPLVVVLTAMFTH